jgi:hypothetical protein
VTKIQSRKVSALYLWPELIVASRELHHAILFEWKGGPNTEENQLRRYAGITAADLRERAHLAPEETTTHDVAIIGRQEFAGRFPIGIDDGRYQFPVLLASDDGISIHRNRFVPDQTDAIFRPRLDIDWGKVPTHFFPVDADSELWEFAALIIPRVLELMGDGETRILPRQLEETIPCWGVMAPEYQGRLRAKINDVMNRASQRHFEPYFRPNRTGAQGRLGRHWDVISNPLSGSSDRRTKDWKSMGLLLKRFVGFVKTGRDVPEQQELNLQPGA